MVKTIGGVWTLCAKTIPNKPIRTVPESVEVIMNSLRDSKRSLNQQIDKWDRIKEPHKAEICKSQLKEVIDVLLIFEELWTKWLMNNGHYQNWSGYIPMVTG